MTAVDTTLSSLEVVAREAGDLPSFPAIAFKAMRMSEDPMVTARGLESVIGRDQALTARILKIVNSAMYCLQGEVSTLSHAITILGLETVRSIMVAASVQHAFQSGRPARGDLLTHMFWEHSWGAGLASKAIAVKVGYPNPEEAFTCGLLHDIGKLVLQSNRTRVYTQIINNVYRGATTFHVAEMNVFGFSHAHVGALLAGKWHFPAQLVEAVLYHHDPAGAPKHMQLAAIISLADLLMIRLEIGLQKNKTLKAEESPSAHYLKLKSTEVERLVAEAENMIKNVSGMD